MGTVIRLVALGSTLVAFSNALSHFDGAGISPSNNPIVNKYHTSQYKIGSDAYVEKTLFEHTIPGIVIGVFLFIVAATYFAHRWCGCCNCILKCCRKHRESEDSLYKTRRRRNLFSDEKKTQQLAHPVVSAILRIILSLLFVAVTAGIVIGVIGSTQFHTSLVETLQKIDDKATDINNTLYTTSATLSSLISVDQVPNSTIDSILHAADTLMSDANKVNSNGPSADTYRNIATMIVYFAVAVPMLLGLIGAVIGKGKWAYAMSLLLPLGLLAMWIIFSFHYAVFIVNVDTCYAVDQFLVPSHDTTSSEDADPLSLVIQCSNTTNIDDAIKFVAYAINQTTVEVSKAYGNQTLTDQLTNQLTSLISANNSLYSVTGCAPVRDLLNDAYTDLCGSMVESSLYLWQTQIALSVILTFCFVFGLVAEHRVASFRRKKEKGFDPLVSLNYDDDDD